MALKGGACHSSILPLHATAASHWPFREKATLWRFALSFRLVISCRVAVFHSRTPSGAREAIVLPSGEKFTPQSSPACPTRNVRFVFVPMSHRPNVPSQLALARVLPSGEKANCTIRSLWPFIFPKDLPVFASQR